MFYRTEQNDLYGTLSKFSDSYNDKIKNSTNRLDSQALC